MGDYGDRGPGEKHLDEVGAYICYDNVSIAAKYNLMIPVPSSN